MYIKELQNAVDIQTARIWRVLEINNPRLKNFDIPPIILNNKLWRTAGYCLYDIREIHLGVKFFKHYPKEMLSTILTHEICHQVVTDLWGYNHVNGGHCPNWDMIMRKMGFTPDRYHRMNIDRKGNKC